jgi:uncharacterized protein (DUF924 family)/glutathione S-transferase
MTKTHRFITLETGLGCGQSPRIAFFLEELGLPYVVDQKPDGHFLQTYGRVGPRLVDAHGAHFESGAMLRHLARVYRDHALDLAHEALVDEWLSFSMRLGLQSLAVMQESWDKTPRADRIEEENKKLASMLSVLDKALADRIYLLGDFGVVDCAFASLVRIGSLVDLARWPRLHAYATRLKQRPTFQRGIDRLASASSKVCTADDVLAFWFDAKDGVVDEKTDEARLLALVKRWFRGGDSFDAEITSRFLPTIEAALRGELDSWGDTPRGRLALILVLDQFTRNVFRDTPRMYAGDERAQKLAVDAIARGTHRELSSYCERVFLGMPLLHAEHVALQEKYGAYVDENAKSAPASCAKMVAMGREQATKYQAIIARFGRFPHRNAIVGRTSTAEELVFVDEMKGKMAPSGAQQM